MTSTRIPLPPPTTPPRLLNTKEAAAMLAISARSLWSLTASHDIPHLRIGRTVRYCVADLQGWIEARKVRTDRER